jgi:hypothetical protein
MDINSRNGGAGTALDTIVERMRSVPFPDGSYAEFRAGLQVLSRLCDIATMLIEAGANVSGAQAQELELGRQRLLQNMDHLAGEISPHEYFERLQPPIDQTQPYPIWVSKVEFYKQRPLLGTSLSCITHNASAPKPNLNILIQYYERLPVLLCLKRYGIYNKINDFTTDQMESVWEC